MTDLFDRFDLGGLALPNRMVMAPMTRTRADENGRPTALMREYYVQRASAGLIVTECTAIRADSAGIIRAPGIYEEAQVEGWREITDAVHAAGGRIYLQVWHCGRISHPSLQPGGLSPVAPSAVTPSGAIMTPKGRLSFEAPRALETAEIPPLVEAFAAATGNAKRAGFDGVELHGAFGYLPEQFLLSGTNTRTDIYGGGIAHRARFMLETVEAMTSAWSAKRVGVKLSPSSRFYGQSDADTVETFSYLAEALDGLRIGYLHVMEPSPADLKTGDVQIEHATETLRRSFHRPIITNGSYDEQKAEAVLLKETAELVSFGTLFLANPDLPRRFREDAPLNPPDPATFYGEGSHGYTDYPFLAG
jgi:N-ethylmaleimide reductase